MSARGLALVIGAGPGLGAALARAWGRAGHPVGLVARNESRLAELGGELGADGIDATWTGADVTDTMQLASAVSRLCEGRSLDRLHVNPSVLRMADPLHLSPDELLDDVRLGVAPLLTAVHAARPFLHARSRVTAPGGGTADRPWPQAATLGVQKAALRNLVASVDAVLAPDGVRAATLTIFGTLSDEGRFSYDNVAQALVAMADRPDDEWTTEVSYTDER